QSRALDCLHHRWRCRRRHRRRPPRRGSPMTRAFALIAVAVAVAVAALVGCSTPEYGDGHLQCAPSTRACPGGFYCAAAHCWRNGSGPVAADLGVADLSSAPNDLAGADLATVPSKCASSSALLCESFESALNGWSLSSTNGAPARDMTHA